MSRSPILALSSLERARWLDIAGIATSFACLVHCLLLPLAFALLPTLSSILSVPEAFHVAALAFAVPVSSWAMVRGYRLHGLLHPMILGFVGLTALGAGTFAGYSDMIETGCTVAGSLLLAAAHVQNWRVKAA